MSLNALSPLFAVFATVFLAELGDKTQLATVLYAASGKLPPVVVFVAAAAALVAATAMAVIIGAAAERYLSALPLKLIAGLGFMAVGAWTLWGHFSA